MNSELHQTKEGSKMEQSARIADFNKLGERLIPNEKKMMLVTRQLLSLQMEGRIGLTQTHFKLFQNSNQTFTKKKKNTFLRFFFLTLFRKRKRKSMPGLDLSVFGATWSDLVPTRMKMCLLWLLEM